MPTIVRHACFCLKRCKYTADAEMNAEICIDETSGQPILSREQLEWFFGQLVGIPMRREKHEQDSMLEKIIKVGKLAAAGRPCTLAKVPPIELTSPITTSGGESGE